MSGERVLLVDDHPGFRASAAAMLEAEGLSIVGTAASGEEALNLVGPLHPDVVLLDLFLTGIDGIDVAWRIARSGADGPSVILISSHDEAGLDPRVISAPVKGFLPKRDLTCDAIRRLLG
jgi:DNA-binding NarL/FixJ family response regulator